MNEEKLHGALVLVNPTLAADPAKGQGKVALVNYDSLNEDKIFVAFANGKEAVYKAEDLLKMKPRPEIMNDLMQHGSAMRLDDYKDMYKISLLLDRGTARALAQAIEIAAGNPGITEKVMQPAKHDKALELDAKYTR